MRLILHYSPKEWRAICAHTLLYTTLGTPCYTTVLGVTAVLHGAAGCAGRRGPGLKEEKPPG